MARTVSKRWKSISEEEKAYYVRRAEEEKQRYYQAMNEWYRKNNEDDEDSEEATESNNARAATEARTSPTLSPSLQSRSGSAATTVTSGPIAITAHAAGRVDSPQVPIQQTSLVPPIAGNPSNDVLVGNLQAYSNAQQFVGAPAHSDILSSVGGEYVTFQAPAASMQQQQQQQNTFIPSSIQPLESFHSNQGGKAKGLGSEFRPTHQEHPEVQDIATALDDFLNGEDMMSVAAPHQHDGNVSKVAANEAFAPNAAPLSVAEQERLSRLALTLGNEETDFVIETFSRP